MTGTRAGELVGQLQSIAEQLAELALECLREAMDEGDSPDPVTVAEERRLTRARRSVEKAVHLLADGASSEEE